MVVIVVLVDVMVVVDAVLMVSVMDGTCLNNKC